MYSTIRRFVIRHWIAIKHISLVAMGLLVAIYVAFAVDLFETEGALATEQQAVIELDEALLLGTLLAGTLLIFGTKHYIAQRREMGRRIAAERYARARLSRRSDGAAEPSAIRRGFA